MSVLQRLWALLLALTIALPAFAATTVPQAVETFMARYPQATLQDLYKGFFQDYLGPGHMVADTARVRRAIVEEMRLVSPADTAVTEPCGTGASYSRVPLAAVSRGEMPLDTLVALFVESARPVTASDVAEWRARWPRIQAQIDSMHLALPGYGADREMLRQALGSGQCAVHHSGAFNAAYHPHYRVVANCLLQRHYNKKP